MKLSNQTALYCRRRQIGGEDVDWPGCPSSKIQLVTMSEDKAAQKNRGTFAGTRQWTVEEDAQAAKMETTDEHGR